MKKLTLFFLVMVFAVSSKADDVTAVANWKFPIYDWMQTDSLEAEADQAKYIRAAIKATQAPANFDAASADFDAVWDVAGTEFTLGGIPEKRIAKAGVDNGPADFTGAFKVIYDDYSIYVLIKCTDEDINNKDVVEIAWAQDLRIQAIADRALAQGAKKSNAYMRFAAFGGLKATFTASAFRDAMLINFDAAGIGSVDWAGTNALLAANLLVDDKGATTGSGVVKRIITIGFPALTGVFRPDFDVDIWKNLNAGKGISFDMKYNDYDTADPKSANNEDQTGSYWWNARTDEAWYLTWHAGFLAPDVPSAVKNPDATKSIFVNKTATKIELSELANGTIYNLAGKQIKEFRNVTEVNISDLAKGVYIVKANGETMKIVK